MDRERQRSRQKLAAKSDTVNVDKYRFSETDDIVQSKSQSKHVRRRQSSDDSDTKDSRKGRHESFQKRFPKFENKRGIEEKKHAAEYLQRIQGKFLFHC